jgi:hypothetical protein
MTIRAAKLTRSLMHPEVLEPGAVDQLIDWEEVEWTPANVAAFFAREACGDEDCEHVHSHFEDQRGIALWLLHDLMTGESDVSADEDFEALQEVLNTIFAATEALTRSGVRA